MAFRQVFDCLPKELKDMTKAPKPTKAQLDNSDEDVRSYIARLEDAIEMARCELTLAAAYAEVVPHPTTNRAALIARIGNALTELGGPIERKTNGTD